MVEALGPGCRAGDAGRLIFVRHMSADEACEAACPHPILSREREKAPRSGGFVWNQRRFELGDRVLQQQLAFFQALDRQFVGFDVGLEAGDGVVQIAVFEF